MRTILIFIDGIGLGAAAPANPFFFARCSRLRRLLGGRPLTGEAAGHHNRLVSLVGLDATLGVAGLPQSATGQATLFTGVNAARLIGAHLNGFPNRALRKLLAEKGMFRRLAQAGYRCTFVNAYRPPFFELLERGLPGRRYSCSTLVAYYGGLTFRSLDDLQQGDALYMDIDNALLRKMGFSVEQITPEEGGERLAAISRRYDFALFEYFLSDLAGHLGEREEALKVLDTLDRFLGAVTDRLDPAETLLFVTSDHGNLEDLSHREHTFNPVPALLYGPEDLRSRLIPALHDLTGVLPAIEAALSH